MVDHILSSLQNRIFLMHDVNLDLPVVFETRWAMSYLRGPLTRNQIKMLMDPVRVVMAGEKSSPVSTPSLTEKLEVERPVLPPDIPQYFISVAEERPVGQTAPVLQPMILGAAQVHFANTKTRIDFTKDLVFLTPITNDPVPVNWDQAKEVGLKISSLKTVPFETGALYSELSPAASRLKNFGLWQRDFVGWLARTQKVELFRSASLGEYSKLGETERDFRVRLQLIAREGRDKFSDELQKKYAPKFSRLDERIGHAKLVLAQQSAQSKEQKFEAAASIGTMLLGSFLGGRRKSVTGSIGRSMKEAEDVKNAEAELNRLEEERQGLEKQFQAEISDLSKKTDPLTEDLEKVSITPARNDISVQLVALAWNPS
jgi:hypothetical protein